MFKTMLQAKKVCTLPLVESMYEMRTLKKLNKKLLQCHVCCLAVEPFSYDLCTVVYHLLFFPQIPPVNPLE